MTGQTNAVKLDEQFTADGTSYIRRPYSFFHGALGHRAPGAELIIAGKIYSLSCSRSRECRYTYKRFAAELGVSLSTVARSIKSLKEHGVIIQDKRKTGAAYKFVEAPKDQRRYIRTERWMIETSFEVRTKSGKIVTRRLIESEKTVLSHIWTHCTSGKTGGTCSGSARSWAGMLQMDEKTVKKAIRNLLGAGLIVRPAEDRGVNGYKRSTYHINGRIVRKLERASRRAHRAQDRRTDAELAADARTERERVYAARREAAESRAESYLRRIMQDAAYAHAERRGRKLDIEIAKAELYSPADVARLRREAAELQAQKAARMQALGVSADDLKPQYICPLCRDTGYLPGGRPCGCYSPQR